MLKDKIKKYSEEIGIDLIGFTDAEICGELRNKLVLQDELGYACEFQKGTIEERTNPKGIMHNCKTIISIGLTYSKTCERLEHITEDEVYFSSSSWGKDYHLVLKEKLTLLADYIKREVPSLEYVIAVDTSPLCDRTIAYKAGLGFFGKNNLLINPKYGSYIFLGSLLTNLDIENDKSLDIKCHNCDKCIKACPTGAINDNGILNPHKCLSYITQKKELTKEEEKMINKCIYGCDICISVCPYNRENHTNHQEFIPDDLEFININEYEALSNKKFKLKYGKLAGSWRGAKTINRNIKLYKNNLK